MTSLNQHVWQINESEPPRKSIYSSIDCGILWHLLQSLERPLSTSYSETCESLSKILITPQHTLHFLVELDPFDSHIIGVINSGQVS